MNASISKSKGYLDYYMGLDSSPLLHGAILPTPCQMKYQHHSSVVNGTDTSSNRDINTGHKGTCEGFVYILPKHLLGREKNWVKCSGSLSAKYKSSSCKANIYLSTSSVYHGIRKHMDERKGFFSLQYVTQYIWSIILPRSHTTYSPFIYVQRIVDEAEGKKR